MGMPLTGSQEGRHIHKKKAERVAVLQHTVIKAEQPQRKGEIGKQMQMKQPESSYMAYKYLGVS